MKTVSDASGNLVEFAGVLAALMAASSALICCASDAPRDAAGVEISPDAAVQTPADAATGSAVDAAVETPTAVKRVAIMPLGDSITAGAHSSTDAGYRAELWKRMLGMTGYSVDFVGSNRSGQLPDVDNEGHSGWRIDQITANIDGWLATYKPDIVLLHIGTNDMARDYNVATAPDRLSALVDKIAADVPGITIVVAQIVPTLYAVINARVETFNDAISAIVRSKVSQGKKVRLVDMYHAIGKSDFYDTLHPNDTGYAKMADVWYSDLEKILAEKGP
ncbi:SGNH/GDSL hydrolase family protein [Pendulispora brunnea]|uniref:SGNH/GDSL hydrolase family protein n=1 Tax=Pendulispora brunnea TaxID=2905690 RepID=A0ABZ2K6C2_9BACT